MRKSGFLVPVFVFAVLLIAGFAQQSFGQTQKGIELYNSWQYKQAESVFREMLKAAPSNTETSFYLGLCVLGQGRFGEALDIFLKIQKSQDKADRKSGTAVPNEYQIHLALAQSRIGLKQFQEAWKNLESARTENNNASDVYVYRGAYYIQQEKDKNAIPELEKAIKLDEKNEYAYYYLGLAYYHTGQAQEAVTALKKFLSLAPNAPEAANAKMIVDKLC